MQALLNLWRELTAMVDAARRVRQNLEQLADGFDDLAAGRQPVALELDPSPATLDHEPVDPPANGRRPATKKRRKAAT